MTALGYYLYDEFTDNQLNGRYNQYSEAYQARDGRTYRSYYRPDWTEDNGSPTASSGRAELPAGGTTTQIITFPSELRRIGTWQIVFQCANAPSSGSLYIAPVYEGGNNRISLEVQAGGGFDLYTVAGGSNTTLVNATWPADTAKYDARIERAAGGAYTLGLNGTNKGSGSDTYMPTAELLRFANTMDVEIYIHTVKIW